MLLNVSAKLRVRTGERSGTAQVAWVGDSTGLVVDMLGRRDAWTTNNHNPQNLQEVARMKAEWGARREFLLFESPEGEDLSCRGGVEKSFGGGSRRGRGRDVEILWR